MLSGDNSPVLVTMSVSEPLRTIIEMGEQIRDLHLWDTQWSITACLAEQCADGLLSSWDLIKLLQYLHRPGTAADFSFWPSTNTPDSKNERLELNQVCSARAKNNNMHPFVSPGPGLGKLS